jgi:hypothetical protein
MLPDIIISIYLSTILQVVVLVPMQARRAYTAPTWQTVAPEHEHRYPDSSTTRSRFVLAAVTQCQLPAEPPTESLATAVSVVQREVTLLSERAVLRTRTTEVATVMILTCAMRCAQRRSLRQEQELLQHHAGVRSAAAWQHGMDGADDHTSEMTFIAVILQRLRV